MLSLCNTSKIYIYTKDIIGITLEYATPRKFGFVPINAALSVLSNVFTLTPLSILRNQLKYELQENNNNNK